VVELEHHWVIDAARTARAAPQVFHHARMVGAASQGVSDLFLCPLATGISNVIPLLDAMMALPALRTKAAPA
jgi:hypothetical protein